MRLISYSKCSKLNVNFKNAVKKKSEKLFSFLDNFIWIGCGNFSLLERKQIWSGVNVLKNGLNISYITKKGFFQLKFPQSIAQGW